MLREIKPSRQVPGEPRRRWFSSPNIDLFVWLNDDDSPSGFQLCYDKELREHALTWTEEHGYSHMGVDAGESRPARPKGSPILVADGYADAPRILEQFRSEAQSLPAQLVRLVEEKIKLLDRKR